MDSMVTVFTTSYRVLRQPYCISCVATFVLDSDEFRYYNIQFQAPLVLVVSVYDYDLIGGNDFVDSISFSFPSSINITTGFSPIVTRTGRCGRSTLQLQYRISSNCPQHRYGLNCGTTCIPQVSQTVLTEIYN